ncbi:hypothetical protein PMAYCL1PPCAC_03075, partial [Pristionchus mayeri]
STEGRWSAGLNGDAGSVLSSSARSPLSNFCCFDDLGNSTGSSVSFSTTTLLCFCFLFSSLLFNSFLRRAISRPSKCTDFNCGSSICFTPFLLVSGILVVFSVLDGGGRKSAECRCGISLDESRSGCESLTPEARIGKESQ